MKRTLSTLLALALALTMLLSSVASAEMTEYPREETVYYFSGMGVLPSTFNPLAGDPSWPVGSAIQLLMYETLFMMDMGTGELKPLLGDSYEIVNDIDIEVKINEKAHFSDGTPVTAADVAYSYELGSRYDLSWTTYWSNIQSVEAVDDTTFVIHQNPESYNNLSALDSMQMVPVLPKAIWEKVEEDAGYDIVKIREFLNMDNPIGSGCYKVDSFNDMGIYLVRDDNYWGVERFGKLPSAKYLANPFYKSNDALAIAFQNNEVDFAQAFIPNIWDMEAANDKIGTYLKEAPYHVEGGMVCLTFNVNVPGLDNAAVRRAIGYAINYDMVGQLAMSGYTKEVVPLLCLTDGVEDKYVDKDALADLMWSYNPDKANELLDEMGAVPGADGIRVLPDGTRMSWTIQTGYGWSDWNAAAEVVSQSCKAVGIEVISEMPESAQFVSNRQTGDFQMCLDIAGENPRPSQPWYRYQYIMDYDGTADVGSITYKNLGRYKNDEAAAICKEIPMTTDEAKLTELHTELNRIYLEDAPVIPIMYRPFQFYEFNSTYWTGWPTEDNGTGVPPMLDRGAGIETFFVIEPAA